MSLSLAILGITFLIPLVAIGTLRLHRQLMRDMGHGIINEVTQKIGESNVILLDLQREFHRFRNDLRSELDGIHKRLEWLEDRERRAPS